MRMEGQRRYLPSLMCKPANLSRLHGGSLLATGPRLARRGAGGEQHQVRREGFILLHLHDISNLPP